MYIGNEAVLHSTITRVMVHDIYPPRPQAVMFLRVVIVSNKQIVMQADTWDPPSNCATLSHVAINSVVGVKLPEDGNNSWS